MLSEDTYHHQLQQVVGCFLFDYLLVASGVYGVLKHQPSSFAGFLGADVPGPADAEYRRDDWLDWSNFQDQYMLFMLTSNSTRF